MSENEQLFKIKTRLPDANAKSIQQRRCDDLKRQQRRSIELFKLSAEAIAEAKNNVIEMKTKENLSFPQSSVLAASFKIPNTNNTKYLKNFSNYYLSRRNRQELIISISHYQK